MDWSNLLVYIIIKIVNWFNYQTSLNLKYLILFYFEEKNYRTKDIIVGGFLLLRPGLASYPGRPWIHSPLAFSLSAQSAQSAGITDIFDQASS